MQACNETTDFFAERECGDDQAFRDVTEACRKKELRLNFLTRAIRYPQVVLEFCADTTALPFRDV